MTSRPAIGFNPWEAFYKARNGQTPANAIRLAIADHQATGRGVGEFVDALRKAEAIVEAAPELVAALEVIDARFHAFDSQHPSLATNEAARQLLAEIQVDVRSALAKARS